MSSTVRRLSNLIGLGFTGDGDTVIDGVASVENAAPGRIVFADGKRAFERALASSASAIVAPMSCASDDKAIIHAENPKLIFARIIGELVPPKARAGTVHPTAIVDASASIGVGVGVGAWTSIGPRSRVGDESEIGNGCSIGDDVLIGRDCMIHPNVTIHDRVRIGDRVIIHSGAVIGGEGFGFVVDNGRFNKFPQIGDVIIEDEVEIGSNTTVDRGALDSTVIGAGTKIDNLVQIAHNVRIGRNCVIAAQTGISGSATIGDGVMVGGQVGIGEHARIESGVIAGGQAGILNGKVIRKGTMVWGTPARPMEQFRRIFALMQGLPSLKGRVDDIERRLGSESTVRDSSTPDS